MRARVTETTAQRAAKAQFDKYAKEYATHVAQSMVALMAYTMYSKWRCSPATCRKRVQDMADMLSAPPILGKEIQETDYIEWCKKVLNLDVKSEIKLKVAIDYV